MSLTLIEPVRVVAHHEASGSWLDLHDANGHVTTVHLHPTIVDAWAEAFEYKHALELCDAFEIEGAPA